MNKDKKILIGLCTILVITTVVVAFLIVDFDDSNYWFSGKLVRYEQQEGELVNMTLDSIGLNESHFIYDMNGWNLDEWIGQEITLSCYMNLSDGTLKINNIEVDEGWNN